MSPAHLHRHATPGAVSVLDIGGDVGAVVVHLGDQRVGDELDIQPVGNPAGRFHTGVHLRVAGEGPARVAVFPEVRTGSHELLDEDGVPFAHVDVVGGVVRIIDMRRRTP